MCSNSERPGFANRVSRGTTLHAKQIVALVLASVLVGPLIQAQSPIGAEISMASQPYVPNENGAIRVQSTIVDVNVVVRDSNGELVTGLKKEDFEIYDQGKKQIISSFNAELAHPPSLPAPEKMEKLPPASLPPPPPRYLGFYFDDENIGASELVFARKAAEGFIRKNMEDTDRAGVFTSSTTVTQQSKRFE